MKILGIADGMVSGAALIENGRIAAAINEERLIRMKMAVGFPLNSICKVLEITQTDPSDIDYVAVAHRAVPRIEQHIGKNTLIPYPRTLLQ